MEIFLTVVKQYLVCLMCTLFVCSEGTVTSRSTCPQHQGSDPSDVNKRVQKLAGQDVYYTRDDDYKYEISICAQDSKEGIAVQQHGIKWADDNKYITVGVYKGAHVTGGTNWLMIKYFHGERYNHHCSGVERIAVVLITCDPGEQRGSIKVIKEYRNRSTIDDPLECYYLFELNHDAACTEVTCISMYQSAACPWFIVLIILVVLETVYIIVGFIYQRYVVKAKGLEQCGGCNFIQCCPKRGRTADDVITNYDFDNPMPVLL